MGSTRPTTVCPEFSNVVSARVFSLWVTGLAMHTIIKLAIAGWMAFPSFFFLFS